MTLELKPRALYRTVSEMTVSDSKVAVPEGTKLKFVERLQAPRFEEWEFYDPAKEGLRRGIGALKPEQWPRFQIWGGRDGPVHPVIATPAKYLRAVKPRENPEFAHGAFRVLEAFEASRPKPLTIAKGTRIELVSKKSEEQPIRWRFECHGREVLLDSSFRGDPVAVMREPRRFLEPVRAGAADAFPPGITLAVGIFYEVLRPFRAAGSRLPVPRDTWLRFEGGRDELEFRTIDSEAYRIVRRRNDPELGEEWDRLDGILVAYDPEDDALPHEVRGAESPKFARWGDLVDFAVLAAGELDPGFGAVPLTNPSHGKSGEHGEPDYRKTLTYGDAQGPHVSVRYGDAECADGKLHETWIVEAGVGMTSLVRAEWDPTTKDGGRLSITLSGEGKAAKKWVKEFEKRFSPAPRG